MNLFLQDPATKFHEAATRIYMKIGQEAHDFFAADIYYHNYCYIDETVELLENDIPEEFFCAKEKNRTRERCAFVERSTERYETLK